jgi:hypothetical protein
MPGWAEIVVKGGIQSSLEISNFSDIDRVKVAMVA